MPIKFRCVYCEKLLGIARRKAGAVVDCPHCGEKLIVPTPEGNDEATPPLESKRTEHEKVVALTPSPRLFERGDFEALLRAGPTFRTGDDALPPKPVKAARPTVSLMPEPLSAPPPLLSPTVQPQEREGFFVSSSRATWLSVAAVVALALAFSVGLLAGRFFRQT